MMDGAWRSLGFVVFALTLLGVAEARAVPVLSVVNGELQGASGVVVSSIFYDVEFQGGTCPALFAGCDDPFSDFAFNDEQGAINAVNALLNQVLLDVASGPFDSEPGRTRGCTTSLVCNVLIPYTASDTPMYGPDVAAYVARNEIGNGIDRLSGGGWLPRSFDSNDGIGGAAFTWAIFTRSAHAPIPEPTAALLYGAGISLSAFAARTRPRST
jgi:hypothetical protein